MRAGAASRGKPWPGAAFAVATATDRLLVQRLQPVQGRQQEHVMAVLLRQEEEKGDHGEKQPLLCLCAA